MIKQPLLVIWGINVQILSAQSAVVNEPILHGLLIRIKPTISHS